MSDPTPYPKHQVNEDGEVLCFYCGKPASYCCPMHSDAGDADISVCDEHWNKSLQMCSRCAAVAIGGDHYADASRERAVFSTD